jgi:hypothetical protein
MIKKKNIEKRIKHNVEFLPISFNQITIRENEKKITKNLKATKSVFYKDDDYQVFPFYKSITQF